MREKQTTTFTRGVPFWVSVRQEHIDKGRPVACKECPVALALRERLPGCAPAVGTRDVDFDFAYGVLLPDSVQEWIRAFDRHHSVGPFEFQLIIPVETGGGEVYDEL